MLETRSAVYKMMKEKAHDERQVSKMFAEIDLLCLKKIIMHFSTFFRIDNCLAATLFVGDDSVYRE